MKIIVLKPSVKIGILSAIVLLTLLCLSLLGIDMSMRNLLFLVLTMLLIASVRGIKNAIIQEFKERMARRAWTQMMKGGPNGKS